MNEPTKRYLTPEEIRRNNKIREQVMQEFPPLHPLLRGTAQRDGGFYYPDGACVKPSWCTPGKWQAWFSGATLREEDETPRLFDTPEDAALALDSISKGPYHFKTWPQLPAVVTLTIDGATIRPTAAHTIRFMEAPDGPRAILYVDGRRCTKPWSIELQQTHTADPYGSSG